MWLGLQLAYHRLWQRKLHVPAIRSAFVLRGPGLHQRDTMSHVLLERRRAAEGRDTTCLRSSVHPSPVETVSQPFAAAREISHRVGLIVGGVELIRSGGHQMKGRYGVDHGGGEEASSGEAEL